MSEIFGIPVPVLAGQLMLGLVNGSFYAMLSLGLAVIFGLLNVINFSHGTMYMMGAYAAWMLMNWLGVGYWWSLAIVPVVMALVGIAVERLFLRWIYHLDHLYGLLLTIGLAWVMEGVYRDQFGSGGQSYPAPDSLAGVTDLGFMILPDYRGWVVLASLGTCFATWYLIERTRLGAYLRAATENPRIVQAFGINVPLMLTLTYGFGIALAGLAGVLAAPVIQVTPLMGSNVIIVVFAVVVIGGLGSILGAIVSGIALGLLEGLTKVLYPEASSTVVFVVMALVLLFKPAGLFGKEE
ncbi:MAG: branched-chain amino acid ABC transporter permease [Burkholderiales bacterium]